MADGSIRVNTKIDTASAPADLKKLEKECEKTGQKIEKVGQKVKTAFSGDTGIKKLSKDCETAAAKMGEVGKTAQAVFTGMSKGQLNSAFKTANKELAKTEEKLAAVEAKIAEIQAGTDSMLPQASTDAQASNLLEMEEVQTAPLNAEKDKLTAQAAEYKKQLEGITAELEKQTKEEAAQNALKTAGKDAVAGEQFLGKIQTEEQYHAALSQTQAQMAAIEQQAARISQQTGVPINNLLQQNSQYSKLAARQELLIKNQDRFKGKVSETKHAANSLSKQFTKVGGAITKSIDKSCKKVMRLSVGLLGVRSAFLVLRRAANSYIEANEGLKNQVDGLWNIVAAAIGPAIQTIVNWLTIGISYINAFVKALWGVDLVARGNALALKKQAKATEVAAGATAKANKQLAGFDEMNKLSDTSAGGGGGGGTAVDTGVGQFKPVEVDTKAVDDFIKKLKTILPIVTAIAAGIAAWKIASFFSDSLKTCAGWALLIAGSVATIWGWCDAWVNGLDWGNFFLILAGGAGVVGGLALAFGSLAGSIGLIVVSVGSLIVGIKDMITNGPNLQNILLVTIGIIGTLIGVIWTFNSALLACPVTWIVVAIIAIIAAIASLIIYWDEVCAALQVAWDWICDLFSGIGTWIYDNVIKPVCDFFVGLWESIKEVFSSIGEWFSNIFTKAWEGIKKAWGAVKTWFSNLWKGIKNVFSAVGNWFKNIFSKAWTGIKNAWSAVKTWFKNIWTGIKNVFSSVGSWFSDIFKKAWNGIKNAFSSVGSFFSGIWNTIKSKFSKIGTTIGNAIGGAFKNVVNSIISFAENTINGFIKAINLAISLINKIPGVEISKLSLLSIPKLAKGGIVNNPGRGVPVIAGEAGAEAVLPLENNTEWMDLLAERINAVGQKIVVPIYLNGRKIAEEVIDLTKRRNFAMNGGTI